jgi:hypothetical protein
VRSLGERATAEARAAERRKRRRLWLGAAVVLAVAGVGGLTAVVVVQQRANKALAAEQAKVEARFKMAADSIELFHTVVDKEPLLQNPGFKPLRTKLLKEADRFYTDLEKLLAGQTDARSRQTLVAGYFQLGELTEKIGDRKEALARQKRFPEAFTALDTSLTIRQKLAKADPENNTYGLGLGTGHAFRGGARVRAGQPAEAAADLKRALELWAKVPDPDVEKQFERSQALAILAGLGGDAKSGVTKDEAKTFADQSVADLAAVVKLGWALPSELKAPDFDALRNRADFQKLVALVEAKASAKPEKRP